MSEANSNANHTSVLADVRRALGRHTSTPPVPLAPFIEPADQAAFGELLARFTQEAMAVRAMVYRISANQIAAHIAEICAPYKELEIATSGAGLFAEMDLTSELAAQGFSLFVSDSARFDHEKLVARLANCGVGLTTADYAIAETGTIVLSSDEKNALLVSLLPPVHIALVRSSQIAASLDEVIGKIGKERTGRMDSSRSVTLITGPSRTSDVELVLSIGVHGPKELHVIIID